MTLQFSLKDKIAFYWNYFISKVFCLWFEVKKPKLKIFLYEMLYSSLKFYDRESLLPSPFGNDTVVTKFGTFRIRPHTADMSNCSPAFERRDVDHLLNLIERLRQQGKRMIFFDIGADIGTFTVTVGNRFRDYGKLRIIAFEPAPSSYTLLKENIALNDLEEKVDLCNFALFNEDNVKLAFRFSPNAPGSSGVEMTSGGGIMQEKVLARTLDAVTGGNLDDCDTLIFKIDVEGFEKEVLKGAAQTLNLGKDVFILVEDFVNPEIIGYLENIGARFICKLTPYNSWWNYCRKRQSLY